MAFFHLKIQEFITIERLHVNPIYLPWSFYLIEFTTSRLYGILLTELFFVQKV